MCMTDLEVAGLEHVGYIVTFDVGTTRPTAQSGDICEMIVLCLRNAKRATIHIVDVYQPLWTQLFEWLLWTTRHKNWMDDLQ